LKELNKSAKEDLFKAKLLENESSLYETIFQIYVFEN
jgi:hypothetical protein